jgi:hypothetical protein
VLSSEQESDVLLFDPVSRRKKYSLIIYLPVVAMVTEKTSDASHLNLRPFRGLGRKYSLRITQLNAATRDSSKVVFNSKGCAFEILHFNYTHFWMRLLDFLIWRYQTFA